MFKLNVGDIVKCIIPDEKLTMDKKYEVLSINEEICHVEVINDLGERKSYLKVRFDKED